MNKLKKIILPFSIVALVAVLIGVALANSKNGKAALGLAKPQNGDITEQTRFTGSVQPKTTLDLGFESYGKVSKIYVSEGNAVHKGQLLAELNPQEANLSYAQSLSDLDMAKADLAKAQKDVEAQKAKLKSLQKNDTSNKYDEKVQKEVIDQAELNIGTKQALLSKYSDGVQSSGVQTDKTKLYAPTDGVITKKTLEVGEVVTAYAPVMSLMGDSTLEIQAYVSQLEVAKLSAGDKVSVKIDANQNENLEAKVSTIDPTETIVAGVASYKVTFTPEFDVEKLKSGMILDLVVSGEPKQNVLIIPEKSVFVENGKNFVLEMDEDKQIKKEVELGVQDLNGKAEVLSGISLQDEIVSFNSAK